MSSPQSRILIQKLASSSVSSTLSAGAGGGVSGGGAGGSMNGGGGVGSMVSSHSVLHIALKSLLHNFPVSSFRMAFAYGSAVFPQRNQPLGKMVDMIFVVENPVEWHRQNLKLNRSHYSGLGFFGPKSISVIQEKMGCGVYYNPFVQMDDWTIKYGVISKKAFTEDLYNWKHLYVAGRLQKPVLTLMDTADSNVTKIMAHNRKAALHAALLLLPPNTTKLDLYFKITELSYMGDFRMWVAENPNKIKNIVTPIVDHFDEIYLPLLKGINFITHVSPQSGNVRQDNSPEARFVHLMYLPFPIQQRIVKRLGYKLAFINVEEAISDISVRTHSDLGEYVEREIRRIVWRSSIQQTIQGMFTAGIFKSVQYGFEKLKKKILA